VIHDQQMPRRIPEDTRFKGKRIRVRFRVVDLGSVEIYCFCIQKKDNSRRLSFHRLGDYLVNREA
jgi:hypothetical protein